MMNITNRQIKQDIEPLYTSMPSICPLNKRKVPTLGEHFWKLFIRFIQADVDLYTIWCEIGSGNTRANWDIILYEIIISCKAAFCKEYISSLLPELHSSLNNNRHFSTFFLSKLP